jgi:hypothetical protein
MINHTRALNINNGRINVEWISIRLTIIEPDGVGTENGFAARGTKPHNLLLLLARI